MCRVPCKASQHLHQRMFSSTTFLESATCIFVLLILKIRLTFGFHIGQEFSIAFALASRTASNLLLVIFQKAASNPASNHAKIERRLRILVKLR